MIYKKNDLISIIVPVYNVEKYLSQCIDSIINQTYKNLEIILINDGSKDNSGIICDTFAKKDKRIMVFHKKNEGVGAARNFGISNATGKYVQFVDSDDFLNDKITENLHNALKESKSDMSVCGISVYDNSRLLKKNHYKQIHHLMNHKNDILINEYLKELIIYKTNVFFGSPDNKLYKLELIKINNISFEINTNLGEDFLFNIKILMFVKKIGIVKDCLYYYRKNVTNSVSKTIRNSLYILQRYDEMYEQYKKLFIESNIYNANKDKLKTFYELGLLLALKNCFREEKSKYKRIEKIKKVCTEVKESTLILSSSNDKVVNKINIYIKEKKIKKLYKFLKRDYLKRYIIRIPYYQLKNLIKALFD